ncbi:MULTISPECIES: DUF4328 domain-containing protein [unclassified Streptomyces]|uniref:DUF4328 domain-containing protein n=1 Tax=unclassified Streptomyces TaxID=2593676 RepID=UPI00035E4357|nr:MULTISPECIES: DUF4328 domain-containing protein [unclassified Streptomyces]MYX33505.1 DUF4328 domain-containing protein [Streptomyces sp. SID8377]
MSSKSPDSPLTLARCAQVAIAAAAVVDVFRAVAVQNRQIHPSAATRHTSGLVSQVFVYLMTIAAVLFLVWLARSRRNALVLAPQAALPGRGWLIGSWFVPVLNFFMPRQFVLDIGRASSPSWNPKRDSTQVNLWWAAWIGHGVVLTLTTQAAPGSRTALAVAEALMLAAAVLLCLLIERITSLQGAALGAPAPLSAVTQA